MIELLNIDCMEYMATCENDAFDLAIVDPPYGISEDGHRENNRSKLAKSKNYHKALWDQDRPKHEYFNELKRVSKNQIIFGANHLCDLFDAQGPCYIVWDKDNSGHFADAELAYTSFPTAVRVFKWRRNGMLQQEMHNKEKRIHPTQKPVQLYNWILDNYAIEGNKILDTHLGSCSSAIACHNREFSLVGCEIDEVYYTAGKKRFKQETAQQKMFN